VLLCCHFVPVKVWHDYVGHHTQEVRFEKVGNAGWVDREISQQTGCLHYYLLVCLDLENIDQHVGYFPLADHVIFYLGILAQAVNSINASRQDRYLIINVLKDDQQNSGNSFCVKNI
jgi:hypothetical protein